MHYKLKRVTLKILRFLWNRKRCINKIEEIRANTRQYFSRELTTIDMKLVRWTNEVKRMYRFSFGDGVEMFNGMDHR